MVKPKLCDNVGEVSVRESWEL